MAREITEDEEKLLAALSPFCDVCKRKGYDEGRQQGVLTVYTALLRYGVSTRDGKRREFEDMKARIAETEVVRKWMEDVFPIINQTYPSEPKDA